MTEFRIDSAYVLNNEIVAETFDDETVLIDVDRGIYFSMQGSAAAIWHAFDVPRTPDAACSELATDLPEAGREMVAKLIRELAEQKLIIAAEGLSANVGEASRIRSRQRPLRCRCWVSSPILPI